MDEMVIHLAAAACAVIFIGMAIFQVLLTLGFPLGVATMGGYHKVLPQKLRIASGGSAIVLLIMGLVLLEQSELVSIGYNVKLMNSLTWLFTLYLAFNSVVNFLSKSKKEKLIMTPVSSIACVLCFLVALG